MANMSSKRSGLWVGLLVLGELVVLCLALFVGAWLRFGALGELNHMPLRALVFALVLMLGLAAMGQYQPRKRLRWFGALARQLLGFVLGGIGLVVLYYALPHVYVGRGVLAIALVLGFLSLALFRFGFFRLVELESFKRRVVVLGAGERAAMIQRRMRRSSDRRGFNLLGFVALPGDDVRIPADRLLEPEGSLDAWAQANDISEIVIGADEQRGNLPMDVLLRCRQRGIRILDLVTFFERATGRVETPLLHPSWLIYSDGFQGSMFGLLKRGFDLLLAAVLLACCWPLMLLVALAIRIESGRGQPILYRQERVGLHGRVFALVKFRSMRTDAESSGEARWASEHDDRVTRVGRLARKMRLDELPQLWNILKGEMSVVGPRPERPQFVADLATRIPYYDVRHSLKPGLAGWAQLHYAYGASAKDAAEKLEYDLYYVKNHNPLFDLLILVETVEVVLFGRGAR